MLMKREEWSLWRYLS